jgi:glycosyltransferase involved in cell wall biosynthesis
MAGTKLFEYLSAGLPALMPDFPKMVRVSETTGCGWVVGESEAEWLAAINGLDWPEVRAAKDRARAAADTFSWENESKKLLALYRSLLGINSAVEAGPHL